MVDLSDTKVRIEELPSDGNRAFEVLAGAVMRLIGQNVEQMEVIDRLRRRIDCLDKRLDPIEQDFDDRQFAETKAKLASPLPRAGADRPNLRSHKRNGAAA
jgi:hypothetical protein